MNAMQRRGVQTGCGVKDLSRNPPLLAEIGGDLVVEEDQPDGQRQPGQERQQVEVGEIDVEDPQGDDGLEHPHDDRNHPSDPPGLPDRRCSKSPTSSR